jgi:hypothetical protein
MEMERIASIGGLNIGNHQKAEKRDQKIHQGSELIVQSRTRGFQSDLDINLISVPSAGPGEVLWDLSQRQNFTSDISAIFLMR